VFPVGFTATEVVLVVLSTINNTFAVTTGWVYAGCNLKSSEVRSFQQQQQQQQQ